MADITLYTSATVPSNTTATVFVYEDTDNDGTAENVGRQQIDDGSNEYVLSGFDGAAGNEWWVHIRREQTSVTERLEVQSISITPFVDIVGVGQGDGTGVGDMSAVFSMSANGDGSGTGSAALGLIRTFIGSGSGDGTGTGILSPVRGLFGDGSGDGTGTGILSPVRGLFGDGNAEGVGDAILNAAVQLTFGIKESIEDRLQFGTR